MNTLPFRRALAQGRPLLLDGAMGTMLQAAGMPAGVSPEQYCLENPDILRGVHLAYLNAGSSIITTCTFGASPFKLAPGLDAFEVCRRMAGVAREAAQQAPGRADRPVFVAGNVGPSGLFARPLGTLEPRELVEGFATQIRGLVAGGADLIFVETQFDLAEARAAVAAARQVCDLPVMVSMTFEHGMSLTGSSPAIFAETMQNLGADVVGTNCSLGPDEMLPVVRELLDVCACPVMAEPNAGLPELRDGRTVFPMGPESFAQKTAAFAAMGARVLGGCCGTTPEHVAALARALDSVTCAPRSTPPSRGIVLTSRSALVRIGAEEPLAVIGERINPTGKPVLGAELQEGRFDEALRLADEQVAAGAAVLDVNVGAPLVDEVACLAGLAQRLIARHMVPLSLDSSNAEAIAAALPSCPGSCLINSISGEEGRMDALGPLCRQYGAPFILLPLQGKKLPVRATERIRIVEELVGRATALGIPRRLILVDILALTISSTPEGVNECLELARWCRREHLPTTIGLSNISFGLPARPLLNATFLGMAVGAGLASCIANPTAPLMRETMAAIAALRGHDAHSAAFIAAFGGWKPGAHAVISGGNAAGSGAAAATLRDAVLQGDKEGAPALLEKELAAGTDPLEIVDKILIPAITEVGERYERREYFLPQLIRAAETMQLAFGRLKPLLEARRGPEKRPVIVLATVEGDIHDIGKNIVALLLGNHGFEVVDAGKDVPAGEILACAMRHKARIIGLSALMTTTMVRMEDTIRLIRERGLPIRVMVGGAAVTRAFAESIGADAYCEDAVSGVRAAQGFLREEADAAHGPDAGRQGKES
ncbi:homocysteine S-methyltransferase family protein [uncultured Desulfovibrio sp.]|uniref:homocysteine S-methyltransferase family protein n=1 Tax=uncultured Desulfovibrio sp. TaxID=167968 RepID=UPI0028045C02|nr:homocysteine S-methyltransferase family protein [uncultured Desulfovibrio sp.]